MCVPKLKVEDAPDYRMRAIQMCIKHQIHQISKIKQGVDLCRQFKLNTLALHMSNYQMLWMLCPAFRENPLPKGRSDGGQTYSREEMRTSSSMPASVAWRSCPSGARPISPCPAR